MAINAIGHCFDGHDISAPAAKMYDAKLNIYCEDIAYFYLNCFFILYELNIFIYVFYFHLLRRVDALK